MNPVAKQIRSKLLEALSEFTLEFGRPPSQHELNERGAFSLSPALTRWGTWQRALAAAGVASE